MKKVFFTWMYPQIIYFSLYSLQFLYLVWNNSWYQGHKTLPFKCQSLILLEFIFIYGMSIGASVHWKVGFMASLHNANCSCQRYLWLHSARWVDTSIHLHLSSKNTAFSVSYYIFMALFLHCWWPLSLFMLIPPSQSGL